MAKLYINKDIVADKDKMENWYLTGEEGLSFPDIQNFLSWIDPNDHVIDIEIHSCGGDAVEGYAIYDATCFRKANQLYCSRTMCIHGNRDIIGRCKRKTFCLSTCKVSYSQALYGFIRWRP